MTDQELFTGTRNHLLTQMKRAVNVCPGQCRYRAEGGLKCAIGVHIPDEKYSPSLEGKGVTHAVVATAAGLMFTVGHLGSDLVQGPQINLAMRLQAVHDSRDPSEWSEELDAVAKDFGLKVERTNQEVYSISRKHLLTQMARSITDTGSCRYRDNSDRKCAIGPLISDEKYDDKLETNTVDQKCVADAAGLTYDEVPDLDFYAHVEGSQISLARALQNIHDCHDPKDWEVLLNQVARTFGLKPE